MDDGKRQARAAGIVVVAMKEALEEVGGEVSIEVMWNSVKGRIAPRTFLAALQALAKAGVIELDGHKVRVKK